MAYYKFLDEDELAEARFKASKSTLGKKDLSNIFGRDGSGSRLSREESVTKLLSEDDEDKDKGFLDSIIGTPLKAAGSGALKALTWTGDKALQGVREVDKAIDLDVLGWQPKADAGGVPQNFREAVSAPESLNKTGAAGLAIGAVDTALTAAIDPLTYVTLGAGAAAKGAATQGARQSSGRTLRFAGREVAPLPSRVDEALDSARTSIAGSKGGKALREAFVPRAPLVDAAGGSTAATRAMADVVGQAQERGIVRQADIVTKAPYLLDDILERAAKTTGLSVDDILRQVGQTKDELTDALITKGIGKSTKILSRDVLRAATAAGVDTSPDTVNTFIKRRLPKEGAEDWVKFGDVYVPKEIKEKVFNLARPEANSELVNSSRELMSNLRSTTLLNPASAIPYTTRNIANGIEFNIMDGVFAGPKGYRESMTLVRSVKEAGASLGAKASPDEFASELRRRGLSETQVDEAMALKNEGVIKTQITEYTDIGAQSLERQTGERLGESKIGRLAEKITRPGAIANQYVEETARTVNALHKMRNQGMSAADAAFSANRAHISYSPANFTKFERNTIKPVAFFYSFVARNPGVVARATMTRPGVMAALTRAGLGFGDAEGPQNSFGEPLGWHPDTPGMSAWQAPNELAKPGEGLNPILSFLADPKKGERSGTDLLKDLVPPAGSVIRWGEAISGDRDRPLDTELKKLSGVKFGVDYDARRYRDKIEERMARAIEEGKEFRPSVLDRLIVEAEKREIPEPYSKSKAQLARALKEAGMRNDHLADILRPRNKDK